MPWTRADPIRYPDLDSAVLAAMNDTGAAAAISAKQNHPGWQNRTGTAEGSIHAEPAEKVGETRFRMRFGSFDVAYFIWLEIGHMVLSARGFQQGGHPEHSFGRFVGGDHTIQRAANAEFGKVGERIRARLGGRR